MRWLWLLSVTLVGCLDLDPSHYGFPCDAATCSSGGGSAGGGGGSSGDAGFVAFDRFLRSETRGLGQAEIGGAWVVAYGAPSVSADGGMAFLKLSAPTNGAMVSLPEVSALGVDMTMQFEVAPVSDGQGTYTSFQARRFSTTKSYVGRVRLNTSNAYLAITKLDGTTNDTILFGEQTMPTPSDAIRIRFQVQGANPTTLRLRAWPADAGEPTGWNVSGTDATPELQDAGPVGFGVYLSGSNTNAPVLSTFRNFAVKPL